jgi:release factor glutamine methyltransferase
MNYRADEAIKDAETLLDSKGVTHYNDTMFLLENVLGKKVSLLDNVVLSEEEYNSFMALVKRRAEHEPMDSLLGFTEFMGIDIPFSNATLSPRQETEIMVDNILREHKGRINLKVLDLCSGSGCIGLAIAKHLKATVTLVDISSKAISVAKNTAEINNVAVEIIESDLFEKVDGKYDIIVTNPPYIPSDDCLSLEKEVVDYDPMLALDGGQDGLDLIRKIVKDSPNHLNKNGLIYMEYGIGQTEDIRPLLKSSFDNIEIVKDYSGIDRYIKGRKRDLC